MNRPNPLLPSPTHRPPGADANIATREAPHAYAPPRLTVFGDLARLTTKVGTRGKKDGGGHNRRTGY
ncbi:MAG: hypothetical protein WBQ26_07535 [Gemmatimonadaceae bacterium]|nr:hypothetical protein [Gemmatimonadaceae bacterium]